ncbi:MAG TPA: transcriptional regulator [Thermoanaerobaculia bacterium]
MASAARSRAAGKDRPKKAAPGSSQAMRLDRVIHERLRLGIVSALAGAPTLTFTQLKGILGATDGNLSVHARRLEEAGYVACSKGHDGRVPKTEFRLTGGGRRALRRYLDHLQALIEATKTR